MKKPKVITNNQKNPRNETLQMASKPPSPADLLAIRNEIEDMEEEIYRLDLREYGVTDEKVLTAIRYHKDGASEALNKISMILKQLRADIIEDRGGIFHPDFYAV